jgi:hypothetical protein
LSPRPPPPRRATSAPSGPASAVTSPTG